MPSHGPPSDPHRRRIKRVVSRALPEVQAGEAPRRIQGARPGEEFDRLFSQPPGGRRLFRPGPGAFGNYLGRPIIGNPITGEFKEGFSPEDTRLQQPPQSGGERPIRFGQEAPQPFRGQPDSIQSAAFSRFKQMDPLSINRMIAQAFPEQANTLEGMSPFQRFILFQRAQRKNRFGPRGPGRPPRLPPLPTIPGV